MLKPSRPRPVLELKYNKFYIGLAKNGQPCNFVVFRPKKSFLRLEPRLAKSDETQEQLETAGLDVMDYDDRWGRYRIRLTSSDLNKQIGVLTQVLTQAFNGSNSEVSRTRPCTGAADSFGFKWKVPWRRPKGSQRRSELT